MKEKKEVEERKNQNEIFLKLQNWKWAKEWLNRRIKKEKENHKPFFVCIEYIIVNDFDLLALFIWI